MNVKTGKRMLLLGAWTLMLLSMYPLQTRAALGSKFDLKGRVLGEDGLGLSSVLVTVMKDSLAQQGAYTDDLGEFVLKKLPKDKYQLLVSGVGIEKRWLNIDLTANTTLQDIVVKNSTELSTVTVVGKSQVSKRREQAFAIAALDLKKEYNSTGNLNKLLSAIPSVRVKESGGMGSQTSLSLNGFTGNQVKFFLDGIPMDHFGNSFSLSNMPLNMVDRIEVYKGVLPVDLGGDALGGAVNVITRTDLNYLDVSYSLGSFHTSRLAVNGALTNKERGLTFRANLFYNYSKNNYKVYAPIVDLQSNEVLGNQWVERFHDRYLAKGMRVEAGWVDRSWADYLLFGMIASNDEAEVQTGATMEAVYGGVNRNSESLIPSLRYAKKDLFTPGLSLSLYGAYNHLVANNTDTTSRRYNWLGEWLPSNTKGEAFYTDAKISSQEYLFHGNLSYDLNDFHRFTLNQVYSSIDRQVFDEVDPENETNKIPQTLSKHITGLAWQWKQRGWNFSLFGKHYASQSASYKLVDQYTAEERLLPINDSKSLFGYGSALSYFVLPKLLPALQLKLSYELAYRLPESNELFGDGLIQQANPGLKPESSQNVNVGVRYNERFGKHGWTIESGFFYRDSKDFILKAVSLTSNPTLGYENVGKVLTQGLEGNVEYRWKDLFHVGAQLTYQNIIDNQQYENNASSFVGEGITENITYRERIPNIPFLFEQANSGFGFSDLIWKESRLSFDYYLNYMQEYFLSFPGLGARSSKKVIPEQLSHDVSLSYTLAGGKYSVVLACTNLSNELLYDNYLLQKPGRAFNLKLRYFIQ